MKFVRPSWHSVHQRVYTTSVTWKSVRGRFGGSFGLPEEFSCILFDTEDQRASIRVDGWHRYVIRAQALFRVLVSLDARISSGSFQRIRVEAFSARFRRICALLALFSKKNFSLLQGNQFLSMKITFYRQLHWMWPQDNIPSYLFEQNKDFNSLLKNSRNSRRNSDARIFVWRR